MTVDVALLGMLDTTHAALPHLERSGARSRSRSSRPAPVDTPFWARARTVDRRLPPRPYGMYRPADVAREVTCAIAVNLRRR